MTERKPSAPHPHLAAWVEDQGPGAMKRLVRGSGRTWAAVGRIVWHGAIPRYETALGLSSVTGIPVETILSSAVQARAMRDQPEAAE